MPEVRGARRVDPFRGFRFRVQIPGFTESGFTKVGGLNDETEEVEYREGDGPGRMRKLPGLTKYDPIKLEKGKAADNTFQRWRNQVSQAVRDGGLPDAAFRKDVTIILLSHQNVPVKSWKIHDAWPSKLEHGDMDASSSDVMIETLTLVHEGLEALDIADR